MPRKMKFCSNRKNDTQIYMHPEEENPFQGVFLYSHLSGSLPYKHEKRERHLSGSLPYKHEKRERHLSGHSLFNIMYEKKISYSQGEVYEL